MGDGQAQAEVVDREHLRILEIIYYIAGATKVVFAFLPLIYVAIGALFVFASSRMEVGSRDVPPIFVGWLIIGIGLVASAILAALGAVQIAAGRAIHNRRHRVFCFVIAALGCINMPWGLALGIFTFVVLGRQSVAQLFGASPPKEPPAESAPESPA